jgi:hypothetical protein
MSVVDVILNFTTEGLDMVGVNQYGGYLIEWVLPVIQTQIYGRAKL